MQAATMTGCCSRCTQAPVVQCPPPSSLPTPPARSLVVASSHLQPQGARAAQPDLEVDANRRRVLSGVAAGIAGLTLGASESQAITSNPFGFKKELNKRRQKIPDEDFKDGPEGLRYYDVEVGTGAEAKVGDRVAVHYEIKWRGITFMTSRMGMGVTGGNPLGFDVGAAAGTAGSTLPGLDKGVLGMRVGGLRKLKVPPELAYGDRGIGEIPPNSTLELDVELLSIKTSPLGYRTRLVEG